MHGTGFKKLQSDVNNNIFKLAIKYRTYMQPYLIVATNDREFKQ